MASSQVEIAASSPFGCAAVHNRRDPFQKNLNKFVASCNDTSRRIDLDDLWVHQPQWQTTTAAATNKCSSGNNPNRNNNNNNSNNNNKEHAIDYRDVKIEAETRTNRWARAREMIFPLDHCDSTKGSGGRSVGVSSLVQKWSSFETDAKVSSRSNGGATTMDNEAAEAAMDPFGDWEPARTAFSAPASSRGRDSDATESERLRVADIIKKLTDDRLNDVGGCESPPRARTPSPLDQLQTEQRCSAPVLSSPRIRGRQAYNDVLMQMERDRQKELQGLVGRKAVSKFSHRGRIQAMLRFRSLHRGGVEAHKEGRHSNTTSSSSVSHRAPIPCPPREKVHPGSQNGPVHSGSCPKELIDNTHASSRQENQNSEESSCSESYLRADHIQDSLGSITSQTRDADNISHKVNEEVQHKVDLLHSCKTSPSQTSLESGDPSLVAKSAEAAITFHNKDIDSAVSPHSKEEEEATSANHPVIETKHDFAHDEGESASTDDQIVGGTCMYWVSAVSHPEVGWQELHSDYEQQEGSNREWIDEVSRPRSDWEDLRQARYQEMLDPFLDNEEIRALLGRKSVSTFLSSGLREKIDRVMISRVEGQLSVKNNETQVEKNEQLPEQEQSVVSEVSDEREGEDTEDEQDEEGQEYVDYFDEYEEVESSVGQQYNESDDNTTSSPPTSWPQKGHDLSDYSYQVASPSTQPSPSNYYSQDNGTTPSFTPGRPAIEMELIYDLRGHMEQLHQEMSELRKSIKCCMDMQIQLQRSIKKEVAVALNHHSDAKNGGRNSVKRVASVGRCVVCCKMQVDSLLYRCGHMCTCFKCAHELQWSSGKCPICRAPIVDVVRTYSNDSPS